MKEDAEVDEEDWILSRRINLAKTFTEKGLETEVLGKMFEKAICRATNIPYKGTYKYESPPPELVKRLSFLNQLIDKEYTHTAERGSRYDFSSVDNSRHISAKTSRSSIGSVAPQVLGQASLKKFAETFGAEESQIRKFIQHNIEKILPKLIEYTFDCPNLYYNKATDKIMYITLLHPIQWAEETFEWTRTHDEWTNSTTLKVRGVPILEIQIHTKSRSNLAIRWKYENLLNIFKTHFHVIEL
jgi:hypothetical protein